MVEKSCVKHTVPPAFRNFCETKSFHEDRLDEMVEVTFCYCATDMCNRSRRLKPIFAMTMGICSCLIVLGNYLPSNGISALDWHPRNGNSLLAVIIWHLSGRCSDKLFQSNVQSADISTKASPPIPPPVYQLSK